MNDIRIAFDDITGKIKPMHAINNMPTLPDDYYNLYGRLTDAHIPYARLHDTGGRYGGAHYVDVENIFPDFSADENDPSSYDFAFTDALLASMNRAGVKPFYRLGCTIENEHRIKAYHIYPPADPEKWAAICEHIILHYNEGWANGFNYGILYWEIWNEPDNEPVIEDNPMWRGTMEQFFELYDAAAKRLKARFPHLKIGGYASCGFYAISNADFSETAHSSSRTGYFVEFFLEFLKHISKSGAPLDFFSWHSYAGLDQNVKYAAYASEKLTEYGFGDAEIIFNEWNPGIGNRGKPIDASNIAAMMCALQHSKIDMCMYYDGQVASSYCGLFDPLYHGVFKAYYAFLAFGELYSLGGEAAAACDIDGVYVLAATDGKKKSALIVNTNSFSVEANIQPAGNMVCFVTDSERDFTEFKPEGDTLTVTAYSVWLIRF